MRSSIALLPLLGLAGASGAWAAELNLADMTTSNVSVPSWSVVGSVSPTFTDNALFSRDDRRPDVYYEPDGTNRLKAPSHPLGGYDLEGDQEQEIQRERQR